MKKKDNVSKYFWLITILVYVTILNDRLSFLNLPLSAVYVLICFGFALNLIRKSRAACYIFLFSFLYIIYVIISPDFSVSLNSKWGMLNWTLKVMLTFFPAYYYARKNILTQKHLHYVGLGFVLIGLISYYLNINLVILDQEYDEDGITNNVGYLFVALLPILFVNIRKNALLIFITYVFVLLSLKRGAILCGIATLPFFLLLVRKQIHLSKKWIFISLLFLIVILNYVIQDAMKENAYVEQRVEMTLKGNSSGRDKYALMIIDAIERYDMTELAVGKGINYSMVVLGNFAHNDWFEILLSMGFLGCFAYLLTFIGIFVLIRNDCYQGYRVIGYMILLLIFIRTLLSMNYYSLDSIPLYYTLGLISRRKDYYV